MAAIKSYTDLEQLKVLTEILPVDSADMHYYIINADGSEAVEQILGVGCKAELVEEYAKTANLQYIPAWSLAALLKLMPNPLKRFDRRMFLTLEIVGVCNLYYRSPDRFGEVWFTRGNIIDAAFEMVCWLLENNYIETKNKE